MTTHELQMPETWNTEKTSRPAQRVSRRSLLPGFFPQQRCRNTVRGPLLISQSFVFALLLLAFYVALGLPAHAQNTMFTYQGRVMDHGTNFSGVGGFKFALVTSTNTHQPAIAAAVMGGLAPNQFVSSVTVLNPGSGYTSVPAVQFSGGGGSGASAQATVSAGSVTGITVLTPGSSYSSAPTVTVAAPPPNFFYTNFWSNDGTSVNGSEPAAAVNAVVSNGLFTVVLGDTTLANMSAIPASVFAQSGLQLRIWFSDGVNGFAALSPLQNLTPIPYAVQAATANSLPNLVVQQTAGGAPNLIGGSTINIVSNGVVGATIAGGGALSAPSYFGGPATNSVTADFGTVGGGADNMAGGPFATISGGQVNTANGYGAAVPGGSGNNALGDFSFAAGVNARATNSGAFVWADESVAINTGFIMPFFSTADNQFTARATGGVRFYTSIDPNGNPTAGVNVASGGTSWTTISDRNAKKNFAAIDYETILDKLAQVPIEQWNYKWEPDNSTPNLGPMAQDFKAAFYPGRDDKSISTLEFDGVELAAIKGLNQKLNEELKRRDAENDELKARLEKLEQLVKQSASGGH